MTERILGDETRYQLLRRLADNPGMSQRELAKEFGISVGRVNYRLKALLDKGYVKAVNCQNSNDKRGYLYQLTYLDMIPEYNDDRLLSRVLGDIARAKGMTDLARQTGLSRESLYRALSEQGEAGHKGRNSPPFPQYSVSQPVARSASTSGSAIFSCTGNLGLLTRT